MSGQAVPLNSRLFEPAFELFHFIDEQTTHRKTQLYNLDHSRALSGEDQSTVTLSLCSPRLLE